MPSGSDQVKAAELQAGLVNDLTSSGAEAVAIASADDAKKNNCDLMLTTHITKVKAASKIGGFLKAIKNTDPSSMSSFNVEAQLILSKLADGSTKGEKKVTGKFEGTADAAVKKALTEGTQTLLEELQ